MSQIVVADRAQAEKLAKRARGLRTTEITGFAALAALYSRHPDAKTTGGDLGFIAPDTRALPPAVRTAAFVLREPGEVSDPVPSEQGFHVLRLQERRPGKAKTLNEVRRDIEQLLLQERRAQTTDALVAQSRERSPVEIFADRLPQTEAERAAVPAPGHGYKE